MSLAFKREVWWRVQRVYSGNNDNMTYWWSSFMSASSLRRGWCSSWAWRVSCSLCWVRTSKSPSVYIERETVLVEKSLHESEVFEVDFVILFLLGDCEERSLEWWRKVPWRVCGGFCCREWTRGWGEPYSFAFRYVYQPWKKFLIFFILYPLFSLLIILINLTFFLKLFCSNFVVEESYLDSLHTFISWYLFR